MESIPFWMREKGPIGPIRRPDFSAHGRKVVRDVIINQRWSIALFTPRKVNGQIVIDGCASDGFHLEYPTWVELLDIHWDNPQVVPEYVRIGFAEACMELCREYQRSAEL